MCSRNSWIAFRKKLIFVFHSTEKSIEFEKTDLAIVFRKLNEEWLNVRLETTMTITICFVFSLNSSISRCLICRNRCNSKVLKKTTEKKNVSIKIKMWKFFYHVEKQTENEIKRIKIKISRRETTKYSYKIKWM